MIQYLSSYVFLRVLSRSLLSGGSGQPTIGGVIGLLFLLGARLSLFLEVAVRALSWQMCQISGIRRVGWRKSLRVGQLVIFYPKFHCELNFIEKYWCGSKWNARENCLYTFTGLRETVPEAFNSVSPATIHRHYLHCMRTIDACATGVT